MNYRRFVREPFFRAYLRKAVALYGPERVLWYFEEHAYWVFTPGGMK